MFEGFGRQATITTRPLEPTFGVRLHDGTPRLPTPASIVSRSTIFERDRFHLVFARGATKPLDLLFLGLPQARAHPFGHTADARRPTWAIWDRGRSARDSLVRARATVSRGSIFDSIVGGARRSTSIPNRPRRATRSGRARRSRDRSARPGSMAKSLRVLTAKRHKCSLEALDRRNRGYSRFGETPPPRRFSSNY